VAKTKANGCRMWCGEQPPHQPLHQMGLTSSPLPGEKGGRPRAQGNPWPTVPLTLAAREAEAATGAAVTGAQRSPSVSDSDSPSADDEGTPPSPPLHSNGSPRASVGVAKFGPLSSLFFPSEMRHRGTQFHPDQSQTALGNATHPPPLCQNNCVGERGCGRVRARGGAVSLGGPAPHRLRHRAGGRRGAGRGAG